MHAGALHPCSSIPATVTTAHARIDPARITIDHARAAVGRPRQLLRRALRLLLLTALGMAGACFLPYAPPCASDADCERSTCTRHGECAAELLAVHLRWTVRGQPAGEPACDGIHALQVVFEDRDPPPDLPDELSYQPVPCTLGQISFDRLSARFDSVSVSAHDRSGAPLDRVSLPIQPPEVRFEIALLAESALVNCRTCAPGLFSAAHEPRRATHRSTPGSGR